MIPQNSFDHIAPKESDFSLHVRNLLHTCFSETRSAYITRIEDALLACSHVITLQKIIYQQQIIGSITTTKSQDEFGETSSLNFSDERTKKVNKIVQRLEQEINSLTTNIQICLSDILVDDFQTKDLDPKMCLETDPREFKLFLNNPNTSHIFSTFKLKITPQTFFQCLLSRNEINNIYNNIEHLGKDTIQSRLLSLDQKYPNGTQNSKKDTEKINFLKILGDIYPSFLNDIKKHHYIIKIESLKALQVYLGSRKSTRDINYEDIKRILK